MIDAAHERYKDKLFAVALQRALDHAEAASGMSPTEWQIRLKAMLDGVETDLAPVEPTK